MFKIMKNKMKIIITVFLFFIFSVDNAHARGNIFGIVLSPESTVQPDSDDIRIVTADGTVLPHFFEKRSTGEVGDLTIVWSTVPTLVPGNNQYWLYYHCPTAVDKGSFSITFTKNYEESATVGIWNMDEGSFSTTARDISGFGNTATVHGATWLPTDGGHWGNRKDVKFNAGSCLSFDGINDYVSVADHPSLRPFLITVAAWIYPHSIVSGDGLMGKTNSAWNVGWGIDSYGRGANTLAFWIRDYGDPNTVRGTVTVGEWNHIAATYNLQELRFYVNGNLVSTRTYTLPIVYDFSNVEIGRLTDNKYNFHGIIDDVRIYSEALPPGHIRALYERRKFSPQPVTVTYGAEEVGMWNLDGEIFRRRRPLNVHNAGPLQFNFQIKIPIKVSSLGLVILD